LGGGEKDFSMLFTYASADHYLAKAGTLGFLITQEVFKSKGAGEGFRKFRLGDRDTLKVIKAHDLVSVQPFEGAANKTAAIILKKRGQTEYPVPYTVWKRKKGVGRVPTNLKLKEARKLLEKEVLLARPIGKPNSSWQTVREGDGRLRRIQGENAYKSRLGARVEPYGVFWLEVKEKLSNGDLIVRNMVEKGKRRISQVRGRIEADLVYPAVRGADIVRWGVKPEIHVLIVQELKKRCGYPASVMRVKWPRTFEYLLAFETELLNRAAYKKYHADTDKPFYSQYNIAGYTFARYKVVWKRMTNDIVAAVIGQHKTVMGWKTIIPTDTTSLFATEKEDEAHYLCAILNSLPVRKFIKSYSSAGRGFGAPSVMEHVGIPKFNPKDESHIRLSGLSKKLHRLQDEEKEAEMGKLEDEVNAAAWRLFEGKK
jgi:hypothetical protein